MEKTKDKVPQLRFPGFTGDWEQCKLSEVFDFLQNNTLSRAELSHEIGAAKNVHYGDVLIKFGEYLDASKEALPYITSKQVADKFQASFLKDGDIIMADTAEDETVGKCSEIAGLQGFPTISGLHTIPLRPKQEFGPGYLGYYMNSSAYHDQLAPLMQGIKVTSVSKSAIQGTIICFPTNQDEQIAIGRHFIALDNLITLHQRKLEEMKEYKKGLLQKMFPKNGESVPEIRFPGFTGDWEQRKFADFTFLAGKRNKEDLPLVPYAITNEHGFIPQNEAHDEFGYMKDTDRTAYNIVPPKTFAYNPARINVGSIGYYEGAENVIVSSLYEVFQTADYVDDRFLWYWFKSSEFPKWIERLQEGSVRLYFYYDKLCECYMMMPSIEEQITIATNLEKLDNLITLHQRKLDQMKEYKKGMLQKMFV